MKIFDDIRSSCERSLQAMGINAECYLLPGGVGLKLIGKAHHNLNQLNALPIVECDLSELDSINLNFMDHEKVVSLVLPFRTQIPFADLNKFNLKELKASRALSSDFESLTRHELETLEIPGCNLSNLDFCQKFALRKLNLADTQVSDLQPLQNSELEELDLFKTRVNDISSLNCEKMINLVLSGTPIKCISPLSLSKKLRKLEIRGTSVSDLSPLAETEIKELYLPGSEVKSIDSLAYLPIENLNIIGLELRDLSCLSTLPLRSLAISPNLLCKEDLEFLENLEIDRLRGPGDNEDQTSLVFFQKYLQNSHSD